MSDQTIKIIVECCAGHRGEQDPRRLLFGSRSVEVAEIVDRWFAPDYRYFKLRDARNDLWIVRHDEVSGEWELTMYERSP